MSNKEKTIIIIPARYASTRFPAKLLADLNGKPVIQWVYEKATQTSADEVWVAADDQRIIDAVESFGGNAIMTSTKHPSGTDRIQEAVTKLKEKGISPNLVVNVQGDEPLISPNVIDELIKLMLKDKKRKMATIAVKADRSKLANDPNKVKAIIALNGKALYFTRAAAPFLREGGTESGMYLHWGIYAYTPETLDMLVSFSESPLEKCEKLEQLRALENGIDIFVYKTEEHTIGIDTPEDLKEVKKLMNTNK